MNTPLEGFKPPAVDGCTNVTCQIVDLLRGTWILIIFVYINMQEVCYEVLRLNDSRKSQQFKEIAQDESYRSLLSYSRLG